MSKPTLILLPAFALTLMGMLLMSGEIAKNPALSAAPIATLLLLGGAIALSLETKRGIVRQRPTPVSDPTQQGDAIPDSLVAGESAFVVTTQSSKYFLWRYASATQSVEQVGTKDIPKPEHLCLLNGFPQRLLFCNANKLYGWTETGVASQSDPVEVTAATGTVVPASIHGIASGNPGTFLIGIDSGNAIVYQINTDTYTQADNITAKASTISNFVVGDNSDILAFVCMDGDKATIVAYRLDGKKWTKFLSKSGHHISSVLIHGNGVYFAYAPTSATKPTLIFAASTGKEVDIGIPEPRMITASTVDVYCTSKNASRSFVHRIPSPPGVANQLKFADDIDASEIHGILSQNGNVTVLCKRGNTLSAWRVSKNRLIHMRTMPANKIAPRCLVGTIDGAACLWGHASVLVLGDPQTPTLGPETPPNGQPERIAPVGSDVFFVTKDESDRPRLYVSCVL